MNADATEVMAEARFEKSPFPRIERLSRRIQTIMDDRRRHSGAIRLGRCPLNRSFVLLLTLFALSGIPAGATTGTLATQPEAARGCVDQAVVVTVYYPACDAVRFSLQ